MVLTKTYPPREYNKREILRYAGCTGADVPEETVRLMEECIAECEKARVFSYKAAYRILPVTITEGPGSDTLIDFDMCKVTSRNLADNLKGCDSCIFLAATVGHAIDRLIAKYKRSDSAKALLMQAIGAERVESLCDSFCEDKDIIPPGCTLRPRFSPGYGDFSLEIQRDFLEITQANMKLMISLSDSLLMSPSKSVTAVIGIAKEG